MFSTYLQNDGELLLPPRQQKKKQKKVDESQELILLAKKKLQQPASDYDKIAAAWAVELQKMEPLQQLFAKKAINEILFEGQMGTLRRDSVQINSLRISSGTPYSSTSTQLSPIIYTEQPHNSDISQFFSNYQ